LFYEGIDSLIFNFQGIEMDAKLTQLGVMQYFTFFPEEGHGCEGANALNT